MPWITNSNGDKEYQLSKYAKEELPTWSEMYEEFWLHEVFSATKYGDKDPYWKIPHNVYLLSVCLNQLNKMVWEDGCWLQNIIFGVNFVNRDGTVVSSSPSIITYTITEPNGKPISSQQLAYPFYNDNPFPPIFTIPLPNGRQNPFILSNDVSRVCIGDYLSDGITAVGTVFERDGDQHPIAGSDELKELIKPYRNYFVTFGKTDESKLVKKNLPFGSDPAL